MQKGLFVLLLSLALVSCTSRSDLERAQGESARLQIENAQLKAQVQKQKDEIENLHINLETTNREAAITSRELQRKSTVPVAIKFRKALTGPGYVAVLDTTVKQEFPIVVTFKSRALGVAKKFQLNLSPQTSSELGWQQGTTIYPGDEILIENKEYEPVSVTCPQ